MSQKLILVKYVLEDEIPIDESSENLQSAYIPDELIDWMMENEWLSETKIKESKGEAADIPITVIDDGKANCLQSILSNIEAKLIKCIEEAHSHISTGILISTEQENDFEALHVWLNVRKIFKEKEEKYHENHSIKLIVG